MADMTGSDILVHPSILIPMRDGIRLSTLILRPAQPGRFPVLLARTPYGKTNEMPNFLLNAVRKGYVIAVQDVRGTGESEGSFLPLQSEKDDGFDTLQWLTEQEYTLPRIGMFGGSYVGFTQFAAAASEHPALATITPRVCTNNPGDFWDNGRGAFPFQAWLEWTSSAVLSQAALRGPESIRDQFFQFNRTMLEGYSSGKAYQTLPLEAYPFLGDQRLSPFPLQVLESFGHPEAHIPIPTDSMPAIPTLFIGGWYDPLTTRHLSSCTIPSGQTPMRLLIGPWDHSADSQVIGDLDFGFHASPWILNLPDILLKWFDFVIKGMKNEFSEKPPVHIFRMGANQFNNFSSWPPEDTIEECMYLHSGGQANTCHGNGTLSRFPPEIEPPDRYTYDPADPVPSTGGALLRSPLVKTGPRDQSRVESRPDVLVYTSTPIEEPLTAAGAVQLTLHVSSSALDTDFTARLLDVHPNGRSFNILQSHFRMRYRDPFASPAPIVPGEKYRIEMNLGATFHTFLPGHSIRLDISSSDFPYTLRNLNTYEPLLEQKTWTTALNTLYHAQDIPSFLCLNILQQKMTA
ncbi:MAG: CocE/NonD family hydrolase [Anaerolineales bacterium]|nr:CocE/NonD family hydrolase [Anaerolineales bacterium]